MGRGMSIVGVGSTGSGKTTRARQLPRVLDVWHIGLDPLNWEVNWITAPTDDSRWRV